MAIYVHIGYPKTASTWLQQNFFPFIQNAYYPPRAKVIPQIIRQNSLAFNPRSLQELYNKVKQDHLILSSENLVGTSYNFGLNGYLTAEHAHKIYNIFPEATILLFIRRQQDIIASNYVQYIKGGGTWGINKYLFHKNFTGLSGLFLFSFHYFEYDLIIRYYQKLFGEDRVKVYLFEEFAENPKLFCEKIAEQLDLKIAMKDLEFKKANPGYRIFILSLARLANLFTEKKMINKRYIIHIPYLWEYSKKILKSLNKYSLFGPFPETINILGKKNEQYIKDYYSKSNRNLLSTFGLEKIKNFDYPL